MTSSQPVMLDPYDQQGHSFGGWSASYADALRSNTLRAADHNETGQSRDLGPSGYSCGNNSSEAFFQNMQVSHAEAERLRRQCRSAANVSAARNQEEKVNFDHFHKSIEAARSMANFARTGLYADASGLPLDNGAPTFLGHLTVPNPTQAITNGEEDAPQEFRLPGATESFDEECDEHDKEMAGATMATTAATDGFGNGTMSSRDLPSQGSDKPADFQQRELKEDLCASQKSLPLNLPELPDAIPARACEEAAVIEEVDQDAPLAAAGGSGGSPKEEGSGSGLSSSDSESEGSDTWPPRPPLLRFKMRIQFSQRFKPSEGKKLFEAVNEDIDHKLVEVKSEEMKDMIVAWLNMIFEFDIKTEYHFEIGFPIIVLTMLDAIYPKRVRWREVDWRFQYKRALMKNFAVLEAIWAEVNMEKAREFRAEHTPMRLENMPNSNLKEKLEFIRLMKRWFDQRIHHAGAYDPMAKRHEYVNQCKTFGHTVKFPPWIKFDKEVKECQKSPIKRAYDSMPEYKRLIWFLGSPEHQTM